MPRLHLTLSLLLVSTSSVWAQETLKQNVTLIAKARPVLQAIADLSSATGVKMLAGSDVARDTLLMRLNNVSLGEAMKKIAEVETATWEFKTDKWILHRTQLNEQQLEGQDVKYRTSRIKSAFDVLARQSAALPPEGDVDQFRAEMDAVYDAVKNHKKTNPGDIRDRMPANRLFAKVIPMLDIDAIARAGDNRLVYSTSPTAMQLPLPTEVLPLVSSFVAKQQLLIRAIAKRDRKMPDFGLEDVNEPRLIAGDPAIGLGKMLAIVRRQPRFDWYRIDMKVFDKRGDLMFWEFRTFKPEDVKAPLSYPEKEEPIPLTPLSAELAKLSADKGAVGPLSMMLPLASDNGTTEYLKFTSNRRTPVSNASAALLAATADPQKIDPLSFAVSENLLEIANRRNDNLVASLPDALFLLFNGLVAVKPTTQQKVFTSQGMLQSVRFSESGGWLLIQPNEPVACASMHVDRSVLAKAVTAVRSEGVLPLGNLLDIANADLKPLQKELPEVDTLYLRLAKPTLDLPAFDFDWRALRVVASLSAQQREAVRQGHAVPADAAVLTDWLYNSNFGPDVRVDGKAYSDSGWYNSGKSLMAERTEAFPQGAPAGAAVSAHVQAIPAAFGLDAASGREELVTPRSLATYRIQGELPRFATGLGQPPAFGKYIEAVDTNWRFFITLHPQLSVTEVNLYDVQKKKDAKPGALPAAIAEGAKQEYRRLSALVKSSGW